MKSFPSGLACEIANINIFKKLNQKKLKKSEKEHIFNYFYANKNLYKIYNYEYNFFYKNKKLKLSLDYLKDFEKLKKIINHLGLKKFISFDTKKIINKYKYILNV